MASTLLSFAGPKGLDENLVSSEKKWMDSKVNFHHQTNDLRIPQVSNILHEQNMIPTKPHFWSTENTKTTGGTS